MRLLVTGGAGFIGSHFVNRTLENKSGAHITVFDSMTYAGRETNLLKSAGSAMNLVRGDIRDAALVDRFVKMADVVVHFAAETHNDNSLQNPEPFLQTNVFGTYNLIESCVRHGVRFHHISTDEVFGDLPLNSSEKFSRKTAYNPSSPYSSSKAASDMLVRAWVRSFGLKATISTCGNNYGPNQHEEKFIPRTILLAALGAKPRVYGSGDNVRDWIHVNDHIDGVWQIIERGRIGDTYLLGANAERSNVQVVRAILRELDLPENFIEYVEDRAGHDLRYAIDSTETREEIGWYPKYKSFEDGIKPVVAHYAEIARNGKIDLARLLNPGP